MIGEAKAMDIINITDVLDITPDGLVYLDEAGQEK